MRMRWVEDRAGWLGASALTLPSLEFMFDLSHQAGRLAYSQLSVGAFHGPLPRPRFLNVAGALVSPRSHVLKCPVRVATAFANQLTERLTVTTTRSVHLVL